MSAFSSGGGISARIGCIAMETPLPAAQVLAAFAQEGAEERDCQQHPVQQVRWKAQRLREVDEQHDAQLARVVPDLVLVRIVENERATLLPMKQLVADAHAHLLGPPRDNQ